MQASRNSECFSLLNKILQDAFSIPSIFFAPPYSDLNKIDLGLRAAVWSDFDITNPGTLLSLFTDTAFVYRLIIIKSNLGFYNIMATLGSGLDQAADISSAQPAEDNEFISVGPFRDTELSANYFTQILKDSHIAPSEMQNIKHMYERMPLAQVDAVVNVVQHILEAYIPAFSAVTPQTIQFTDENHMIAVNADLLEDYSAEYASQYKYLLTEFLGHITSGDGKRAREALKLFLQETMLLNRKNMREYKTVLQLLNDYCHTALMQSSVHPHHVLKQAASIRIKIEEETSLTKLEQMPGEICHKYYLLFKNYAHSDCSKLTKSVMSYIQFHLEEELSLKKLAEHFGKNASSLSNAFSKDAGMSITAYIMHSRVQAALRLFNTTDMSVSEVATSVGYQDFSYFSKVFTKHVGCSPRAYRNRT